MDLDALGLSCRWRQLLNAGSNFLSRDEPEPSALGARSLNRWTTREVPHLEALETDGRTSA